MSHIAPEEVQTIIDEVVADGPGAIPSEIKAVPSILGNKYGYKGVVATYGGKRMASSPSNSLTFEIAYGRIYGRSKPDTFSPPLHSMKGWSVEDIARAYVYCKELIFAERGGIGSGALFILQLRVSTVKRADQSSNRSLKEGETAVFPLWGWREHLQQNSGCKVTGEGLTFDLNSRTSISIDRMTEDFKDKEDWAHSTANCRLVCQFVNTKVTWKKATISAFFVDYQQVSTVLSDLQSLPEYNFERKLRKKLILLTYGMNRRNKNKFQKHYIEEIPEIHTGQLHDIIKQANFCCIYGGLPLLPYHKSNAFQLSVERPYVLLPYLVDNITFVSEILNAPDHTRQQMFDLDKKYSLSDPFLKSCKGRGWSEKIVDETRQRYASGAMSPEVDADASLKEASDWRIVNVKAGNEHRNYGLSDGELSDDELSDDEDSDDKDSDDEHSDDEV